MVMRWKLVEVKAKRWLKVDKEERWLLNCLCIWLRNGWNLTTKYCWWEMVELFWFGESESTHTKLGKWEVVYQWKAWDDGTLWLCLLVDWIEMRKRERNDKDWKPKSWRCFWWMKFLLRREKKMSEWMVVGWWWRWVC